VTPAAPAPFASSLDDLPVVERDAYAIVGERARGGVGRILEAIDVRLGRRVAIKELLVRGRDHDARFLREACIASSLQHPATIPVWPDGTPFIAMKLVEGRALDALVAEAPSTEARLAFVPHVLRIAQAMAYAHALGVLHRDIKPANVLVGPFGETVLIDWGMGKQRYDEADAAAGELEHGVDGTATVSGSILGTPAYMAPEQAAGQGCDERSDVYAIGALLYHALAGAPPYAGSTATAIVGDVLRRPPRPLAASASSLPPELVTIVERAMARDPARRYAGAAALADDLRRYLAGQLVSAHRYTLASLAGRWVRRHRALVALAGAFAVIAVVAGALALRSILRARDTAEERTRRLVVAQARSLVDRDPTAAVAWLKLLDERAPEYPTAHALAVEAAGLGVATHVVARERLEGSSAFTANGRHYLDASGEVARVIELATGRERFRHVWPGAALVGQLTMEGPYVALWTTNGGTRGTEVRVYDWQSGERVLTTRSWGEAPPVALVDPPAVVVRDENGALVVNDLVSMQERRLSAGRPGERGGRPVTTLLARPGTHLLAEIGLREVWVWDTTTWTESEIGERIGIDIRELQGGASTFSIAADERETEARSPGALTVAARPLSASRPVAVAVFSAGVALPLGRGFQLFEPSGSRVVEVPRDVPRVLSAVPGHHGLVASCHADGARLWRRERLVAWLRTPATCSAIELSPDGDWIAVVGEDRATRLFHRPDGPARVVPLAEPLLSLMASPAGALFAGTTRQGDAVLLALDDGSVRRIGLARPRDQLFFSSSGRYLFTGGEWSAFRSFDVTKQSASIVAGGVKVAAPLDGDDVVFATTDSVSRAHADGSGVTRIAELDQAPVAATAGAGWVALSDASHRICVYPTSGAGSRSCLDPDGAAMAVAARRDALVRLTAGQLALWRPLVGGLRSVPVAGLEPEAALWIDDGLVAAWGRAEVGLLTPEGGAWRPLVGHRDRVRAAAVVPGARALITAAQDGTARLWDVDSGRTTAIGPRCRGPVRSIAVRADGREAAILCDDDTLLVWIWRAPRGPRRSPAAGAPTWMG